MPHLKTSAIRGASLAERTVAPAVSAAVDFVPEIVPVGSQNLASRAKSSQVGRTMKWLKRADLQVKTTMAEMLIGV
jgi:hypothetical protein